MAEQELPYILWDIIKNSSIIRAIVIAIVLIFGIPFGFISIYNITIFLSYPKYYTIILLIVILCIIFQKYIKEEIKKMSCLEILLGLILVILFFCIDKLLFFILFMLSYSTLFPDSKIDTKDLDFFVPAFFCILALAISLYWQSKDLSLNLGIIFCWCVVLQIYSCRVHVHIIEYIYNGMIKLKENIIFVLTNKWIMLFSSFFFITIFDYFKERDDIYMNIIIVYIILINIFITIDITRNRFEFERNKEVFYSVIASMIWMIYCIVQYMKDI